LQQGGLEARDELELQLHDDLSITGAPFGVTEACTIKYGRLRPPERQASSGSPGWKGLWGARKTGPVDLGAVEFVQSFFDDDARGDETTWAATLYSDSRGAYMEGYWSGACEGRFRADKTSEERQRTATRSFSRERRRSGSASPRTPGVGVRSPSRRQGVAKGTLTVRLIQAKGLVAPDESGKLSNAYAKLSLQSGAGRSEEQTSEKRSKVRDPTFDDLFTFDIDGSSGMGPVLHCAMYDGGGGLTFLSSDSFLGSVAVDLSAHLQMDGSTGTDSYDDEMELEDPESEVDPTNFQRQKEIIANRGGAGERDNP